MDDAKALIADSHLRILACDNLDEAAKMVRTPVASAMTSSRIVVACCSVSISLTSLCTGSKSSNILEVSLALCVGAEI